MFQETDGSDDYDEANEHTSSNQQTSSQSSGGYEQTSTSSYNRQTSNRVSSNIQPIVHPQPSSVSTGNYNAGSSYGKVESYQSGQTQPLLPPAPAVYIQPQPFLPQQPSVGYVQSFRTSSYSGQQSNGCCEWFD